MKEFIEALASGEPTPGGGGAAALVGSLAAALGSMVANLTSGKKKYAQYQKDIDRILEQLEELGIQEGDTVRIYGHVFDYYK